MSSILDNIKKLAHIIEDNNQFLEPIKKLGLSDLESRIIFALLTRKYSTKLIRLFFDVATEDEISYIDYLITTDQISDQVFIEMIRIIIEERSNKKIEEILLDSFVL